MKRNLYEVIMMLAALPLIYIFLAMIYSTLEFIYFESRRVPMDEENMKIFNERIEKNK